MAKAIWEGVELASSNDAVEVEGNQYFPPESVDKSHLRPSDRTTQCPWKGTAHYYDVVVGDKVNRDAAWYYPEPKPAAENIKDRVAFWKGVEVSSQ